ncbi:MAG: Rieske (2Fe-2S) protein [Rhizobacter sp.]|nr:Rieske (2Fe-2S) protein [Rhizobacter sp.]
MKRQVFTQEFFDSLGSSAVDINDARMLPPECYVSPDFFEFERDAVFDGEWLCVGRESWARQSGDYFTSSHAGEPIVVTRGGDGVLRAFSNVCQHRAMLLAENHGNAKSLICQYHHWAYDLEGRLAGAPAMEQARGFDRQCVRLPEFKVEVWLGFVFINFSLDAAPLAPRLVELTAALERYDVASLDGDHPDPPSRFPWNWKVMMENNNDGYHANKLHAGPVHNIVPSQLSVFPKLSDDAAGYLRFNGTRHADAAFNPTLKALLPIFPGLTQEDRQRFVFGNIPPTLSLVVMNDQITYMILHANSVDEVGMTRGWLVSAAARQDPLFREKLKVSQDTIKSIVAQDLHVDELITTGLRSRFAARGRYSWQEQSQRDFNHWLVRRYQKRWAARPADTRSF